MHHSCGLFGPTWDVVCWTIKLSYVIPYEFQSYKSSPNIRRFLIATPSLLSSFEMKLLSDPQTIDIEQLRQ